MCPVSCHHIAGCHLTCDTPFDFCLKAHNCVIAPVLTPFCVRSVNFVSFSSGPGLAIRVLCADTAYIEKDFAETSVLLKIVVDYSNAVKTVSGPHSVFIPLAF